MERTWQCWGMSQDASLWTYFCVYCRDVVKDVVANIPQCFLYKDRSSLWKILRLSLHTPAEVPNTALNCHLYLPFDIFKSLGNSCSCPLGNLTSLGNISFHYQSYLLLISHIVKESELFVSTSTSLPLDFEPFKRRKAAGDSLESLHCAIEMSVESTSLWRSE